MLCDIPTIDLFKKVIKKNGYIDLPAQGNSMFPIIQKADICRFISCSPLHFKKGDIILFHSQNGQLIAHRFCESKLIDGIEHYFFKGDSNLGFDQPIVEEQVIGKLIFIQKRHSNINMEDFRVSLWSKLILSFPSLSGLLRKYLNWKSLLQL